MKYFANYITFLSLSVLGKIANTAGDWTRQMIFALARLFVFVDYPWAERETAPSLIYLPSGSKNRWPKTQIFTVSTAMVDYLLRDCEI